MKKNTFIFIAILLIFAQSQAQVGINETDPKATLDINGDLIIKNVPELTDSFDKILTLNGSTNRVKYTNAPIAPKSYLKGKGGIGFTVLGATLISDWNQISFPTIEFDENADYNTTSQYFEAPTDGIYNIYVYVKMTSLVNVSDLGVGIFKNVSGVNTLIADETYESLSVTVIGIGITSPPTRSTQTLVKLNTGDRIYFGIKSNNLLVFNNAEAQFSIFQLK